MKFSDYKEEIKKALKKRNLYLDEPLILVDGFVSQPIFERFPSPYCRVAGLYPELFTVAVVGENSGQVFFLAIKILLQEFDVPEKEEEK